MNKKKFAFLFKSHLKHFHYNKGYRIYVINRCKTVVNLGCYFPLSFMVS